MFPAFLISLSPFFRSSFQLWCPRRYSTGERCHCGERWGEELWTLRRDWRMEKIRNVWFMWTKDNLNTKKLVGVISAAAPAPFIIWDYIFCLPILIKRHLLIWLWNLWGKEEHCASSLKEHYVDLLRDFLCNLEPCTVSVWNITV